MARNRDFGSRLIQRGVGAFQGGSWSDSERLFDQAMTLAIERGDAALWDRAFCNRCALDIEKGRSVEGLAELREIVMRTDDPETAFLAAYNAARAYDLRGEHDRALFYVSLAKDRCGNLGRRDWMAWSHNQAGNLYLSKSRVEDACLEYQTALALMPEESRLAHAQVLDNLGYCRMIQGRLREGFGLVFDGLRRLRRLALEREQAPLHLSLCHGYLDAGRPQRALRHALRGLDIAERHEEVESVKNAHYLVGEAYNQLGDEASALRYFRALQERFFPRTPHIPELLLAVDVRSLINLKAG